MQTINMPATGGGVTTLFVFTTHELESRDKEIHAEAIKQGCDFLAAKDMRIKQLEETVNRRDEEMRKCQVEVAQANKRAKAACAVAATGYSESVIMEFIGFLSVEVAALHRVSVPELRAMWEKFKVQRHMKEIGAEPVENECHGYYFNGTEARKVPEKLPTAMAEFWQRVYLEVLSDPTDPRDAMHAADQAVEQYLLRFDYAKPAEGLSEKGGQEFIDDVRAAMAKHPECFEAPEIKNGINSLPVADAVASNIAGAISRRANELWSDERCLERRTIDRLMSGYFHRSLAAAAIFAMPVPRTEIGIDELEQAMAVAISKTDKQGGNYVSRLTENLYRELKGRW